MEKLTVEELKHMYMESGDLVKIFECGKLVYAGQIFLIPWKYYEKRVERFRVEPEIRRKDWREAGTWAPTNPEAAAAVNLKDVEMRMYYCFYI